MGILPLVLLWEGVLLMQIIGLLISLKAQKSVLYHRSMGFLLLYFVIYSHIMGILFL